MTHGDRNSHLYTRLLARIQVLSNSEHQCINITCLSEENTELCSVSDVYIEGVFLLYVTEAILLRHYHLLVLVMIAALYIHGGLNDSLTALQEIECNSKINTVVKNKPYNTFRRYTPAKTIWRMFRTSTDSKIITASTSAQLPANCPIDLDIDSQRESLYRRADSSAEVREGEGEGGGQGSID